MICLVQAAGRGPVWALCRRHTEARLLANLLLALAVALLLRELL